jgi:hypothetical protein
MTTRSLKLAKDLSLPLDAVTQTIAILAKRRAGKSYTMRRLAEQLFKAGQQIVLVDPKGDQWGIRSAADGKAPGLPIVILGGERGDVPLEASSGEIVAKLVVEDRVSVLLDLSQFRKHEVATFMTAFLENLYRLKAREIYRTPVMLVIDEADAVAPQKPQKGEERMLGAAEDIVRRGGQRGIGCVLVTQRSAVLNKNVLTQAQMLVVLRTIAPQDLAAMKAWIDVHGDVEQGRVLMESLPSLPIGDAWFWSPGWPTVEGIFKRVHILPIETFDSGASPKPGVKPVEPKHLADVDLDALKGQMAATIEKAKADDPRELRKQISDLTRQLAAKPTAAPSARDKKSAATTAELRSELMKHKRALEAALKIIVKVKAVDFNIDNAEERKALEQAVAAAVRQVTGPIEKRVTGLAERVEGFKKAAAAAENEIRALLDQTVDLSVHVQKREPFAVAADAKRPPRSNAPRPAASGATAGDLSGPEVKILTSLAELEVLGLHPADKQQLGLMAGYTNVRSGGFSEPLGRLVAAGLVVSPQAGVVAITDAGRARAGQVDAPSSTQELQQRIMTRLTGPEQRLLTALLNAYPTPLTKEALGAACNYTNIRSGGFSEPLGRLSTLGLVMSPTRGEVVASSALFLEGR